TDRGPAGRLATPRLASSPAAAEAAGRGRGAPAAVADAAGRVRISRADRGRTRSEAATGGAGRNHARFGGGGKGHVAGRCWAAAMVPVGHSGPKLQGFPGDGRIFCDSRNETRLARTGSRYSARNVSLQCRNKT